MGNFARGDIFLFTIPNDLVIMAGSLICVRSSMDRASDSGSESWGFESLRACQNSRHPSGGGCFVSSPRRDSNPERVSGGHRTCRGHVLRREVRSGCAARTADAQAAESLRACPPANQASRSACLLGKGPATAKHATGIFRFVAASSAQNSRHPSGGGCFVSSLRRDSNP